MRLTLTRVACSNASGGGADWHALISHADRRLAASGIALDFVRGSIARLQDTRGAVYVGAWGPAGPHPQSGRQFTGRSTARLVGVPRPIRR